MKAWKKGAIVGGVWGLLSIVIGAATFGAAPIILWFPFYSKEIVNTYHQTHCYVQPMTEGMVCRVLIQGNFAYMWPVFIGILIGLGIGILIDKYNTKNRDSSNKDL